MQRVTLVLAALTATAAAAKVATQFTVGHTVRAHEDLYREMLSHWQREELRASG